MESICYYEHIKLNRIDVIVGLEALQTILLICEWEQQ